MGGGSDIKERAAERGGGVLRPHKGLYNTAEKSGLVSQTGGHQGLDGGLMSRVKIHVR